MNINAFSNEQRKISDRAKELQEQNAKDTDRVRELESEYETAVASMNDEKADKLHKEMFELERNINNRTKKISILQSDKNPSLERTATETIKAYYTEREKQRQEAEKIIKELEQVREQYFKLCGKLKEINEEHSRIKEKARRANKTANHRELPQQAKSTLLSSSQLVNLSDFEILLQDIQENIYKAV